MRSNLSCFIYLIIIILNIQLLLAAEKSTKKEINDYIYGLKYDRDELLSYKGESITNIRKKEGRFNENNTFIVITRELKNIYNSKADVGILTNNEHKTYPGSLLLANYRLVDNSPDIIAIGRLPLKYTINLPGFESADSFTIIPSYAEYHSNLNRVLNLWFNNYPYGQINSIFQSDYTIANSKEQLRVIFGPEFKYSAVENNIDFDSINDKSIVIYRFKQIFYTVSVESPKEPADLFTTDVTIDDLSRKTDSKNPPLIVDSVSYGRIIYVKIETSSTDENAKFILQHKIKFDFNNTDKYIKQLKNFNMQVYVMGGNSEEIDLVNAKTVEDVNNIIIKYGKFNKENLGYPLSYTSQFLKDNTMAVVKSSTDYTVTKRTEHQKGIIQIKQAGWTVSKWNIQWDEIIYDYNGTMAKTRKSWEENNKFLISPIDREIELGGNCDNIYIRAKVLTGLPWKWSRTVFERSGIPLIRHRTFSVWGTSWNPKYEIEPDL